MKVFLILEPHFCSQFVPCKLHPVNFGFSTLRRCSESALSLSKGQVLGFGFWISTESPLKSKKSVRDAPPLLSLFIFSTKFRLPTPTASDHRASRADN